MNTPEQILHDRVNPYNDSQPSTKLRQRLTDIHGLLYKLDSFMLLVNERVIPKPPRAEPILSTLPLPPPYTQRVTPSVVQCLASPSDVTSGPIEEVKPPAAHVDLLMGSAEEERSRKMAGLLQRNAEHFSTALAADQAVLRSAEEKMGANYDVMKREQVRLRDHRGAATPPKLCNVTDASKRLEL
ncbi:hypothetical protein F5888DRAFT_1904398 [Russula emetica]|nr:hypothetical protein F5888DRAFT_1904398 [Russula emetica]